jgi:hypothetical protein
MSLRLDEPCTQAQFGEVIGVSQQAVSEMLEREVIERGATLGEWLLAYCAAQRKVADGRDSDLARERTIKTRVERLDKEIDLEVKRKTYAPVGFLDEVLATVGRKIAGTLDPLAGQLAKLCPALTPEDVVMVQRTVSQACDVAAAAALAVLDELEAEVVSDEAGADGDGLELELDDDEVAA